MSINFHFVRHAESKLNAIGDTIGGRSEEIPLTEKGQSQAIALGKYFAKENMHFDEAHCSTAVRTQQTAKCCFSAMSCQLPLQCHEALLEQHQGDWEKKLRKPIYQKPEVMANCKYNNWKFIPGDEIKGESQKQVGQRMANWVKQVISEKEHCDTERNIVVFTHGLSIKYMLATLFKTDPKWQRYAPKIEEGDQIEEKSPKMCNAYKQPIENTSITQIKYENGNFILLKCNQTPHLV